MSKQRRTIAIDFDGVLHKYEGYRNGLIQGPMAGAKEAVEELQRSGMTLVVFSTRSAHMIREWLEEHGFPRLHVTNRKEPFWLMIDDRAMPFAGEWSQDLIGRIKNFRPYWIEAREGEANG